MKPYQRIAIAECHEPLVELPEQFARVIPHPYTKLGAPYGDRSPFFVRQGILDRLLIADSHLQKLQPGWKIQIFDAYRPVAVQQFMVDYTLKELVNANGLDLDTLSETQREEFQQQVYQFWAMPNLDPATPPPHSTGAAIDISLLDETGNTIDMGSEIDEISERSFPNHFENSDLPYHRHREILAKSMISAGFKRHWNEWWHFSHGDQIWAWITNQDEPGANAIARYGRV
ncbi:peptidase M15D, vanX D-ala-D-ala dipeptidase [Leptolyngbya sp. NIES-3755]|nr:peptidase M15D, vanX D-ala-D-ala dipeptidase [Leptolyngbya sp. NIES-3755]